MSNSTADMKEKLAHLGMNENAGHYYMQLISEALKTSKVKLDDIQFNFSLHDAKKHAFLATKEGINELLKTHLDTNEGKADFNNLKAALGASEAFTPETFLQQLHLPDNAGKVNSYLETLKLRGESFFNAAQLMLNHSFSNTLGTNEAEKKLNTIRAMYLENIKQLDQESNRLHSGLIRRNRSGVGDSGGESLEKALADLNNSINAKGQAHFDAFIKTTVSILHAEPSVGLDRSAIKKQLKNAETLVNIKEHKAQFTFSGDPQAKVNLQIDIPNNRFAHLSNEQKREWVLTYYLYSKKAVPDNKKAYLTYLSNEDFANIARAAHPLNDTQNSKKKGPKILKLLINKKDPETETAKLPAWFSRLSDWEKKHWMEKIGKVIGQDHQQLNENVAIAGVVKKAGIPGLRNALKSLIVNLKYAGNKYDAQVSPFSVRSSNLISAKKEGVFTLTKEEEQTTIANIHQTESLYLNTEKAPFSWKWKNEQRVPKKLGVTLVRPIGGGDNGVLKLKNQTIGNLNKANIAQSIFENDILDEKIKNKIIGELNKHEIIDEGTKNKFIESIFDKGIIDNSTKDKLFKNLDQNKMTLNPKYPDFIGPLEFIGSNHSIGVIKALREVSDKIGSNTTGIAHLIPIVDDFFENAVFNHPLLKPDHVVNNNILKTLLNAAKDGKLTLEKFESYSLTKFTPGQVNALNPEEILSLKRVLLALNNYVQAEKGANQEQNYQVHLAALEEIIFMYTDNQLQSSCKSGKDREGVEKTYRNALITYFGEYGSFPPVEPGSKERDNFVKIFDELFNSHHQAILAQLNADGCEGQKALSTILPKDIKQEISKNHPELLKQHKQNSALNDLKKAIKVVVDEEKKNYDRVKNETMDHYHRSAKIEKPISRTKRIFNTLGQIELKGPSSSSSSRKGVPFSLPGEKLRQTGKLAQEAEEGEGEGGKRRPTK